MPVSDPARRATRRAATRTTGRRPRRRTGRVIGVFGVVIVLVGVLALGFAVLRLTETVEPLPGEQRCLVRTGDHTVVVDLEQAKYAAIIAGRSVQRGLPARAASIALATAYQESSLRNLDYGDRDSVGLFQQRPSQGWGTMKQIMDPVYASDRFYAALVKIDNWESDDINDVAQKVQRSAYPEAYRDHEADGRALASALTGHSAAAVSCLERQGNAGDPRGLATLIDDVFGGDQGRVGPTLTLTGRSATQAWAYGQFAVANAAEFGVASVRVGSSTWTSDAKNLASWIDGPPTSDTTSRTVVITTRG